MSSPGPDAGDIASFTARRAIQSLRIHVGREEADTSEGWTEAAMAEMNRVGGWDRAVLMLAMPTGAGWLDPGSHDVVEFLRDGGVATVAVQHSRLYSALALVFETNTGLEEAVPHFHGVYDDWAALPPDERLRLCPHRIDLESQASQHPLGPFRMLGDRVAGAFRVGPPFPSDLWRRAEAARNEGSPFVPPGVGDGRLVRSTNGRSALPREGWEPFRVLCLQHGSDGIVCYDPASAWHRPTWLKEPPAPDESPVGRWTLTMTMAELALAMTVGQASTSRLGSSTADEDLRRRVADSDPLGLTKHLSSALPSAAGPRSTQAAWKDATQARRRGLDLEAATPEPPSCAPRLCSRTCGCAPGLETQEAADLAHFPAATRLAETGIGAEPPTLLGVGHRIRVDARRARRSLNEALHCAAAWVPTRLADDIGAAGSTY